jgi:hypothetical protein
MAIGVLDQLKAGERALVPSFWPLEVLNVLLVGERRGRITPQQTQTFFDALLALNPAIDSVGWSRSQARCRLSAATIG